MSSTPPSTCCGWPTTCTPAECDSGWVNERAFPFSAGVGLDASVVERVDAHPRLKARLGEWYYTWTGVGTFNRRYLMRPPRLEATLGDELDLRASPRSSRTARPTRTSATARWRWARAPTLDSGDLGGRGPDPREPDRHPDDHLAGAVRSTRGSAATGGCTRSPASMG